MKDDKQRDKIKTTLHRSNPGLYVDLSDAIPLLRPEYDLDV